MPRSDLHSTGKNEPNDHEPTATLRPIHRAERIFRCLTDYRNQPRFELEPIPEIRSSRSTDRAA